MSEFEAGGQKYRTRKLGLFAQAHLVRKLGPLITRLPGPVAGPAANDSFLGHLAPLLDSLAAMNNADVEEVLGLCLGACQRLVNDSVWADVWNQQANRVMYEDIDLVVAVEIAKNVMQENLGGFFGALPGPGNLVDLPRARSTG